jgi:agmatine/peptidylarginine deiminase
MSVHDGIRAITAHENAGKGTNAGIELIKIEIGRKRYNSLNHLVLNHRIDRVASGATTWLSQGFMREDDTNKNIDDTQQYVQLLHRY